MFKMQGCWSRFSQFLAIFPGSGSKNIHGSFMYPASGSDLVFWKFKSDKKSDRA